MLLFEKTENKKVYENFKSLIKHHLITALHYAELHKPFACMREFGSMCSLMSMYTTITGDTDLWIDDDITALLDKLYSIDFKGISFSELQDIVIDEFEEVGENNVTFN